MSPMFTASVAALQILSMNKLLGRAQLSMACIKRSNFAYMVMTISQVGCCVVLQYRHDRDQKQACGWPNMAG